jgi:5-methylcytosine-specific restriction endonuclease McrA
MSEEKRVYPKEFLEYVQSITNKRAKVVIDHILAHGFITTDDLQATYGYTHAPRAAMDVKDTGIPLETFKVKSDISGRQIGAYRFGDITQIQTKRIAGRIAFSKKFKKELYELSGGKCTICNGKFEERYLQIDHRVPYEVSGDIDVARVVEDFMLLCGSCNRAKSWSCEHCDNWKTENKPPVCMQCYWGSPENYNHIAMEQVRRLDLQWNGDEIKYYDALKVIADHNEIELPEFIKQIISDRTKRK